MIEYIRKRLSRRFFALIALFFILVLGGAAALVTTNQSVKRDYDRQIEELQLKQQTVAGIQYHLDQMVLHARSYYAFLKASERDLIYSEKDKLVTVMARYEMFSLSDSERAMAQTLDLFINKYTTKLLPELLAYAEKGDYVSLRAKQDEGIADEVNGLLVETNRLVEEGQKMLIGKSSQMFKELSRLDYYYMAYIMFILALTAVFAYKLTKDIGDPLQQLTFSAEQFAAGGDVSMEHTRRMDEIGVLTGTFHSMMIEIRSKEEELVAQNEELQAQQDELQSQQDELQSAISNMEENERYLERRNKFIQSLSNTLDSDELLESIASNMVEALSAHQGMIVLLNANKDHASYLVPQLGVSQLLEQMEHGNMLRAVREKKPYTVIRDSSPVEKGFHADADLKSYDMYVPVLSQDDDVIACFICTRVSQPFGSREIAEAMSLSRPISLSLDKMTMYKQMQGQSRLIRDLMNTIQEGILLVGNDGSILHVNVKLCQLLGYSYTDDLNNARMDRFYDILSQCTEDTTRITTFIDDVMKGRVESDEVLVYELNGTEQRFVQMYFEPLYRDNEKFGTVFVHRDITREHEVDRMKSEFVSTVSHELRTPLASVLGFAELLLNKELTPERRKKYVSTIHKEANRLTGLINDFLDVQRMEAGKQTYEKETCDLFPLIRELTEMLHTPNHQFRMEQLTENTTVSADRDKMRQLFLNLLQNAVKYSPSGGSIEIGFSQDNDILNVDITDHGLGIPEEALPQLFGKFYRIDNSDRREIGGTGLGLAIVKEIVKAHDGRISVKSVMGEGSTFTVSLPVSRLEQAAVQEIGTESRPFAKDDIGIVIIEDDNSLSELLEAQLQEYGFHVHHFPNGEAALKEIPTLLPEAVVVDLILKDGIDGWTVIGELKRDPRTAAIPVFISSALDERKKGEELGIANYLIKPYRPVMLSQTIMQTLLARQKNGEVMFPFDSVGELPASDTNGESL